MFDKLTIWANKPRFQIALKGFMSNKIIKQTSETLKVPYKQALAILAMDDFWDDAKQYGNKALSGLKDFYNKNRHAVNTFVADAVITAFPESAPFVYGLQKVFGGRLMS